MKRAFKTFPRQELMPRVVKSDGPYLHLSDGSQYLDLTAGITGFAILGGGVSSVVDSIKSQLECFPHADYKTFDEPLRDRVAALITGEHCPQINRVFFSGGSGSEALEMARQLSYQCHYELGNRAKSWSIGTMQSYHGSTTGALAVGERPNLEFFECLLPSNRARIEECNYIRHGRKNESPEEYGIRAAEILREKILEIGPSRVGCFVGETMLGGLVGDVTAPKTYWPRVRQICDEFNVHLILDEVWCGGHVSGRQYAFLYEGIIPDFIMVGKSLGAGYYPFSAVLTQSKFEDVIASGSGRTEISCTFQGHAGACAAVEATQRFIRENNLTDRGNVLGKIVIETMRNELSNHEFLVEIRGRGIRNSIEFDCESKELFAAELGRILKREKILVSSKWHRLSLTHSLMLDEKILKTALNTISSEFKKLAANWTEKKRNTIQNQHFY